MSGTLAARVPASPARLLLHFLRAFRARVVEDDTLTPQRNGPVASGVVSGRCFSAPR
jgi:hypothetical protein